MLRMPFGGIRGSDFDIQWFCGVGTNLDSLINVRRSVTTEGPGADPAENMTGS